MSGLRERSRQCVGGGNRVNAVAGVSSGRRNRRPVSHAG